MLQGPALLQGSYKYLFIVCLPEAEFKGGSSQNLVTVASTLRACGAWSALLSALHFFLGCVLQIVIRWAPMWGAALGEQPFWVLGARCVGGVCVGGGERRFLVFLAWSLWEEAQNPEAPQGRGVQILVLL